MIVNLKETAFSKDDLELINQYTLEPLTEKDVYVFKAKLIDDDPTANNRVWTREWQVANAKKFEGVPVTLNHDTQDASLVIGRVYQAFTVENATYGMVYIPLNTETGKEAADKIKNGQMKSMSINSKSKKSDKRKAEDGTELDFILPSEDDRILEVSFVAVPGCASCGVTSEADDDGASDSLTEFARAAWKELQDEYTRLARFALGAVNRKTYQSVAESVDPLALKEMVNDLKRTIADKNTKTESLDAGGSVKEEIEKIRELMGV